MKQLYLLLILISHSLFAQEWKELGLLELGRCTFTATSELDDEQSNEMINYKYGAINLFDGNYTTAWVEGVKGDGSGESVYVVIPNNCKTINIFAGYGKNSALYISNNRVKRLKLSCYVGISPMGWVSEIGISYKTKMFPREFYIDLKDIANLQTFPFPFSYDEMNEFREKVISSYHQEFTDSIYHIHTILQLKIEDVYKGSKYEDACISELFFSDIYIADNREFKYPRVEKIYVDKVNNGKILLDTPEKKNVVIVDDSDWVFQISEVSTNNQWATVIRMPSSVGEGRTETEYLIIDTRLGRVMNTEIERTMGESLYGPFFLKDQSGTTVLELSNGTIVLR